MLYLLIYTDTLGHRYTELLMFSPVPTRSPKYWALLSTWKNGRSSVVKRPFVAEKEEHTPREQRDMSLNSDKNCSKVIGYEYNARHIYFR